MILFLGPIKARAVTFICSMAAAAGAAAGGAPRRGAAQVTETVCPGPSAATGAVGRTVRPPLSAGLRRTKSVAPPVFAGLEPTFLIVPVKTAALVSRRRPSTYWTTLAPAAMLISTAH